MVLFCARDFLYCFFPNIFVIAATSWINEIKTGGLAFAVLQELIKKQAHESMQGFITSAVRTSISIGFIVGPWIGVNLVSFFSYSVFFIIHGIVYIFLLIFTHLTLTEDPTLPRETAKVRWKLKSDELRLLLLTVIIIVLLSTGSQTSGALLVLVLDKLLEPWAIAAIISVGPIFEVLIIPLVGLLNDRIGTRKTLLLGGVAGTAYFLLLAISKTFVLLLLLQIFGTLYTAVLFTSLIFFVQNAFRDRLGFSSSLFFSGNSLSSIIGNALLGSVLVNWGYDVGFLFLGGMTLAGVFLVVSTRGKTSLSSSAIDG